MEKNDIEIWQAIPGFEGKYEASSLGRIRSLNYLHTGKTKVLKTGNCNGYLCVSLCKNGKPKTLRVNRLVFSAFNGPIPPGMQVDHINNVRTDNRLQNLQLLTGAENSSKAHKGKKLSEDHKMKLHAGRKGKPAWNKGKTHSEEAKAKISAAGKGRPAWNKGKTSWNRGKKLSEEAKAKISAAMTGRIPWNKGKTHSEETKAKLRASQKARREREKN